MRLLAVFAVGLGLGAVSVAAAVWVVWQMARMEG